VDSYHAVLEKIPGGKLDLVVLDDGFQQWRMKKNVEVLAVTSKGPSERVYREFPSQAGLADLVVWTKGKDRPDSKKIDVQVQMKIPAVSQPKQINLIVGVGDPEHVLASASEAGYVVKNSIFHRDHFKYSLEYVTHAIAQARKEGVQLATTEKDFIKWKRLGVKESEVVLLKQEIFWEHGQEAWSTCLWGGGPC
jgi:tetraacyldisaccharide-1-P 4'-kinase